MYIQNITVGALVEPLIILPLVTHLYLPNEPLHQARSLFDSTCDDISQFTSANALLAVKTTEWYRLCSVTSSTRFERAYNQLGGQYPNELHRLYVHRRPKRFAFLLGALLGGVLGGIVGNAVGSQSSSLPASVKSEFSNIRRVLSSQNEALVKVDKSIVQLSNNIDILSENERILTRRYQNFTFASRKAWSLMEEEILISKLEGRMYFLQSLILQMDLTYVANHRVLEDMRHGAISFTHLHWDAHLRKLHKYASSWIKPDNMKWEYVGSSFGFLPSVALLTWAIHGVEYPVYSLSPPVLLIDGHVVRSESVQVVSREGWCGRESINPFCFSTLSQVPLCRLPDVCSLTSCEQSLLNHSRVGCSVSRTPTSRKCYVDYSSGEYLVVSGECSVQTVCNSSTDRSYLIGTHRLFPGRCSLIVEGLRYLGVGSFQYRSAFQPITSNHLQPLPPYHLETEAVRINALDSMDQLGTWTKENEATLGETSMRIRSIGTFIHNFDSPWVHIICLWVMSALIGLAVIVLMVRKPKRAFYKKVKQTDDTSIDI